MTSGVARPVVGKGFLKIANFCKIIDANSQIKHIELSNYGEVFLNPELLAFLRYAHENSVLLNIVNGANLNTVSDKVLEGVVRYKLRTLCCSIDGATNASYTRYRVGGNLDAVIDNIEKINHFKKQYRSEYPRLKWQFIVFGHNQHEISTAHDLAQLLGMEFVLKLSWDDHYSPVTNKVLLRQMVGAATRDEHLLNNGTNYMRAICHQLWDWPQINWDGKLLGCSRNFWGDFGGNAFRDGLVKSLNNEKIMYAREMLQGRQPTRRDIPCSTCELYQNRRESGKWLKRQSPMVTTYLKTALRYYLPWSLGRYELPHKE